VRSAGLASVLALVLAAPRAGAEPVVVKLGTLAPSGSAWHEILNDLGRRWKEASGGAVVLKVYAGGTQGSEGDMIRKLGIGQLQAVAITNVGMNDVTAEPKGLSLPFLFADDREAECALAALAPDLEAALLRRSYVVLHWSSLGAMHVFCTAPRPRPADMAGAKLFAQDGDPEANDAWRAAGFRPVVLSSTEMLPALQTGMIDCLPNVPIYVLTTRLYEKASHMMEVPWGHLFGATLVRRDVWERIPAALRPALLEAARETGRAADAELRRLTADALAAMRQRGLVVDHADPAPWRELVAALHPRLRGKVVPAAFYDRLMAVRASCAGAGAPPPRETGGAR
jgi:TRAP-type C4-dicarboxylate transport system substrate-binding protein